MDLNNNNATIPLLVHRRIKSHPQSDTKTFDNWFYIVCGRRLFWGFYSFLRLFKICINLYIIHLLHELHERHMLMCLIVAEMCSDPDSSHTCYKSVTYAICCQSFFYQNQVKERESTWRADVKLEKTSLKSPDRSEPSSTVRRVARFICLIGTVAFWKTILWHYG